METLFLAKIMGIVLIAFSAAGLARPQVVRSAIRDFDHESFARLVIGCIAIGVGAAFVLSHNVWTWDYRGLVTLFGWTVLVKGIFYLVAPKQIHSITKRMLGTESQLKAMLIGCLVVGLYLAYKGFGY
ncbi:MAG: hypothetical protein WA021_05200 [Minisyncoccia bacterium]